MWFVLGLVIVDVYLLVFDCYGCICDWCGSGRVGGIGYYFGMCIECV